MLLFVVILLYFYHYLALWNRKCFLHLKQQIQILLMLNVLIHQAPSSPLALAHIRTKSGCLYIEALSNILAVGALL